MTQFLTDPEIEELGAQYPDLSYDRNRKIVKGELSFCAYYDGTRLFINSPHQQKFDEFAAYYEIEINLKKRDDSGFPIVREVGGKINKAAAIYGAKSIFDFHISQDGACCLSANYFVDTKNYTFMRFLNELVCGYFSWHAYLEAFGKKAPWGEYSHSEEGQRERIQEILSLGRNDSCFCGSRKKLKRCCIEKQSELRRLKR